MNHIDKTAHLGPNVVLGQNNIIGPNVIISGNVEIGSNNSFGPNCVLSNNVVIGDENNFIGFAAIGSVGEMGSKGDVFNEKSVVEIGHNNTFREFIAVNSPVRQEKTQIGHKCYFMARSHVHHDAIIGDNVIMATNSCLGGGCVVSDYVYFGFNAHVHQRIIIGEGAMLGMSSASIKHIPPFSTIVGIPSRIIGVNRIGLERRNIAEDQINELIANYDDCLSGQYDGKNPLSRQVLNFIQNHENILR